MNKLTSLAIGTISILIEILAVLCFIVLWKMFLFTLVNFSMGKGTRFSKVALPLFIILANLGFIFDSKIRILGSS